jgi:hypothetical protein
MAFGSNPSNVGTIENACTPQDMVSFLRGLNIDRTQLRSTLRTHAQNASEASRPFWNTTANLYEGDGS